MAIDWSDPFGLLLKGYFHQDWTLDGKTALEVLQSFRDDEPEPVVRQARQEAADLLAKNLDEAALENELERRGLQYYPPGDGLTHRAWLEQVVETFALPRQTNGSTGGRD
jgi:uncharacterized membrane protein